MPVYLPRLARLSVGDPGARGALVRTGRAPPFCLCPDGNGTVSIKKASISRVQIDKQLQSNRPRTTGRAPKKNGRELERRGGSPVATNSRREKQSEISHSDMRTQVLFFLTFALLAVLAQSSNRHHHHHSHVQSRGRRPDSFFALTKNPPLLRFSDQ